MITEEQLKARTRKAWEAEVRFLKAQARRDAGIRQAVAEGKSQTWVAGVVGVTKARIGVILHREERTP